MDEENLNNIVAHDSEKKVRLLMSFTGEEKDVSDQWYTGDFLKSHNDIYKGR